MDSQEAQPIGVDADGVPAKQAYPLGTSPFSGFAPPLEARWAPGQSGNPLGAAASYGSASIRAAIKRRMAARKNADGEGERAAAAAERFIEAVLSRDEEAVRCELALLDQVDGKPRQNISADISHDRTVILEEQAALLDAAQRPPQLPE